ncbi:hypothetical protein H257_11058 [Aphanomyces astaci]|uniref:Uncharacterized protein n=1 Tax=Aphanomyces astaci TaxID=112090 RepID=W4G4C8_APHAT|nr:hypothetical protein H257_11058 [Aphanomyces astaci]ETV74540.1 hypothetical protein H257_11058 [Aphanomyces astaci]|eukprot:XP_009836198.1 hypothetical protein H257_11058 [Aphanomyces astaci]
MHATTVPRLVRVEAVVVNDRPHLVEVAVVVPLLAPRGRQRRVRVGRILGRVFRQQRRKRNVPRRVVALRLGRGQEQVLALQMTDLLDHGPVLVLVDVVGMALPHLGLALGGRGVGIQTHVRVRGVLDAVIGHVHVPPLVGVSAVARPRVDPVLAVLGVRVEALALVAVAAELLGVLVE